MKELDARGLACPQPVINARKALEAHDAIRIVVDGTTAVENLKRMAESIGAASTVTQDGEVYAVSIVKPARGMPSAGIAAQGQRGAGSPEGPRVVVLSGNTMGRGNEELGAILMRSFLHTLAETSRPDFIVLFNTGVKLAAKGSDTAGDLAAMEAAGTKILACGTCINYFNLAGELTAGTVSNMYDIAGTMFGAGKLTNL